MTLDEMLEGTPCLERRNIWNCYVISDQIQH